jgi:hypothetical protein
MRRWIHSPTCIVKLFFYLSAVQHQQLLDLSEAAHILNDSGLGSF